MKRTPRLLSVGRSAETPKLQYTQTLPGLLKMQNDAKNAQKAKNKTKAKNAKDSNISRMPRMRKFQSLQKKPRR